MRILERKSNWDLTLHIIDPYLHQEFSRSIAEEEYEHS